MTDRATNARTSPDRLPQWCAAIDLHWARRMLVWRSKWCDIEAKIAEVTTASADEEILRALWTMPIHELKAIAARADVSQRMVGDTCPETQSDDWQEQREREMGIYDLIHRGDP